MWMSGFVTARRPGMRACRCEVSRCGKKTRRCEGLMSEGAGWGCESACGGLGPGVCGGGALRICLQVCGILRYFQMQKLGGAWFLSLSSHVPARRAGVLMSGVRVQACVCACPTAFPARTESGCRAPGSQPVKPGVQGLGCAWTHRVSEGS